MTEGDAVMSKVDVAMAWVYSTLISTLRAKHASVHTDWKSFRWKIASDAQQAADANKATRTFALVRTLAVQPPKAHPGITDKDGALLHDSEEIVRRWREFFAELLAAGTVKTIDHAVQVVSDYSCHGCQSSFAPTYEKVATSLNNLNGGRALGPDNLSATILKLGGEAVVQQLLTIILRATRLRYMPVPWRGGQLLELYKGKGPTRDCSSYRGLLIGDHAGKVFTSLLQNELMPHYTDYVAQEQCGALPGRSTAL